jgi:hypothetical protein
MIDNLHTVKGVVYSKDVKSGKSKKPNEPDWQMCIMKVEADVLINGKNINTVCEYIFDWNVSFDGYEISDSIEADFYIINKKIKKKDGTGFWEKEEKRIVYIKFADIQNNNRVIPKKEADFNPPTPRDAEKSNDNDDDKLPF